MPYRFRAFLKVLYIKYKKDNVESIASQIAYNALFSVFPLLIIFLAMLTFTPLTSDQFLSNIKNYLPSQIYELIKSTVEYSQKSGNKIQLLSFGTLVTIFSASRGMAAVMVGLNKAYGVKETRKFFKVQGMSVLFTLLLAILIIVMLLGLAFGDIISSKIIRRISNSDFWNLLWNSTRYFFIQVFMFIVLELLYIFVPNKRLKLKQVFWGSLVVTVFSDLFTWIYSIYIMKFTGFSKTYGSIGAVMILLLWLYYNCVLVLVGGEINAILYRKRLKKTS